MQRGIMQTMEHPTAGPFKMPGWPVRFSGLLLCMLLKQTTQEEGLLCHFT